MGREAEESSLAAVGEPLNELGIEAVGLLMTELSTPSDEELAETVSEDEIKLLASVIDGM